MGWFKVDDQLAFHQKAVVAGNAAMGLWVRAGSWSCAQLTDGFIAKAMANAMANECDADALVMAGLWDEVEGGYQFHDWSEFQPSAEDEKEKRKARSLAGKKGAAARWSNKTDGKPIANAMANRMANGWQKDAPDPDPDPEPKVIKESVSAKPKTRREETPEHRATTKAYEATGKAFNFIAVRSMTKWMISDRGLTEDQASQAITDTYQAGKPITKQVLGQLIDGYNQNTSGSQRRLQQGMDLVQRTMARGQGAFDYDPFEGKAIEQ